MPQADRERTEALMSAPRAQVTWGLLFPVKDPAPIFDNEFIAVRAVDYLGNEPENARPRIGPR